jgi:cyclohexanone monooxygenase
MTETTTTPQQASQQWTRLVPTTPVNVEALREKYAVERAQRITKDAAGYRPVPFEGKFAHFDKDPNASGDRGFGAVTREVEVLVIGGGFMGLVLGSELTKSGIDDFLILDVAADFGGTWYWNRYPGVRCDVESYIYLPLLEETGYVPREKYSTGSEIFEYCRLIGDHFGLYEHAMFQTRVTGMTWSEEDGLWTVTTDQGDEITAKFVASQSGLFMRPRLPGVPGLEDFQGHSFHTSRWDYAYTGQNLENLADKRVAVVGTGATGIQVVPEVAAAAKELFVIQRTPDQVTPRANAATDTEWFKSLPKGWQRERIASFDKFQMDRVPVPCDVEDGWMDFARHQMNALAELGPDPSMDDVMLAMERSDMEWNEMLRERVDGEVDDPRTAENLKAWYRTQCKRLGFSDNYLPAFNRPNVTLVASPSGIQRFTERGVVVDDREYEVDCIVYASGFEQGSSWTDKAGYDVIGRNGARLSEKFATELRTHYGFLSNGYPNLFFLGFTQTATVGNFTNLILEQAEHVSHLITTARDQGIKTYEATEEAENAWTRLLDEQFETRRDFLASCTPGFYSNDGKLDDKRNTVTHVYLPGHEFFTMLENWRDSGDFDGLVVTK